jgi:two-component system, LytTR family, sensor histidine kinase AlgZ
LNDPRASEPWLPDFCRLPRLGAMLGMAELVVIVVALVPDNARHWDLRQFMSASAFALWLAIAVTALLCGARAQLSRLPVRVGTAAAIALAAAIAVLGAGIVHALFASVGAAPLGQGTGFGRFVLGSAAVVALITALALRYFYVSDRWTAQLNANARAEADALQARIRPHFLFNSMNLIASLLRRDPAVAERAVLDLSDLFRAALGAGEDNSTLAAEVELAERYLSIESLRLGQRLQVQWNKHEPLPWSLPLPRLVLQPLVENAVLHGISRLPEGGTLTLQLRADAGLLHILIRNPSLSPDADGVLAHRGAGHAQRSIAHRLAYRFGAQARMTAQWRDGYYECEIVLPFAAA